MSLYHFTNCLLVLAILVLLYIPNSPEVVVAAGTVAAGTAFGSMLLTRCFLNCCNRGSDYVTRCGSNTFTM